MRTLAKQTGLTDIQVRDWFKQKRIDEDVPTIIEERASPAQLNNSNPVKSEPLEHTNDYGFEIAESESKVMDLTGPSEVKKEPTEDDEPDSAVLDPTTGKLVKQRTVDKDMEKIMMKAPVLESLAKKIEEVNQKTESSGTVLKDQVSNVIDILDDEIEITEEHIVNPGNKEKPISKILNKFLTQVEELEKNILDDNNTSNFQLMKENRGLKEGMEELSSFVSLQQTEITSLEKELRDKNEEIESILLNSVSKETFVRNQFQSLISEVRELRKDKTEKKELQEKIRELERQLKNKSHEAEDWKEKYEVSLKNMKELEETSTNMIGEITKGVAEKLALAKTKEKELSLVEEKNNFFIEEVASLEKQINELNDNHCRIREDLEQKLVEKGKTILEGEQELGKKGEEIVKLKCQVVNLTKRFKEKVKEIQETLSKYNETLMAKNTEISDRDGEIHDLKETQNGQAVLIKLLKDSVSKMNNERSEYKLVEVELKEKLKCCHEELERMKVDLETREKYASRLVKRKRDQEEVEEKKVVKVRKLLAITHAPSSPQTPLLLLPELDMFRFPALEVNRESPTVGPRKVEESRAVVPYCTHPIIEMLSSLCNR